MDKQNAENLKKDQWLEKRRNQQSIKQKAARTKSIKQEFEKKRVERGKFMKDMNKVYAKLERGT